MKPGQRREIALWLCRLMLGVMVSTMALSLTACGKEGDPQPPGPANEITYPRAYPPD
ncbi:hypothetical protein [Formicincola oecophyllae]|uniref:hypothetical protein n=1 Tax=Formicincola oecophyllae TaxID=2558361 RepID=UPI00143DE54A|nr:hypothetical protein [Formicincola oecophyllae]